MNRSKTLTAAFVRSINRPGRYGDGRGSHGLSLLVKPTANGRWSKTWSQRLRINGRVTSIGLGSYPVVTLAMARERALRNRQATELGRDPRGDEMPTFSEAADRVIALHSETWRPGSRSESQWRASLNAYVLPRIGDKPVDEIAVGDILGVLAGVWTTRPETARRLAQRVSRILTWAMGAGYRTDDPTAAAVAALPRHTDKTQHHRALHHSQIPAALLTIRASQATPATVAALELLTLTACRSGEVRGADWSEFDLDTAVWTIPPDRAKTSAVHRVPLSSQALELLAEARRLSGTTGLTFPSPSGRVLSDNTLSKLMRELGLDATPHGMRSAFRSWCADTGVNREVAELALGHAVRGVEASYQRSDLLESRRTLMQTWADHIAPRAADDH